MMSASLSELLRVPEDYTSISSEEWQPGRSP